MKPLSTVINFTLLAAVLVSVPGDIRAQQSSASTQELGERLLDAVDDNDVKSVRSILSIASGRSLVALPIGLKAAGQAIERGYYEVAHHILAVRTQQIQLEKEEGAESPLTKPAAQAAGANQQTSPAKPLGRTSPAAQLEKQTPESPRVVVPTSSAKPTPRPAGETAAPTSEPPPPPPPGRNPFESSHTPEIKLPTVLPFGQPDSRSDQFDTSPAARVAEPPNLPLRAPSKHTEADTTPATNLPTPINALADTQEPEKTGFFGRILDKVFDTLNPFQSEPEANIDAPEMQEIVRSPDPSDIKGEPPTTPAEHTPTPETVDYTAEKPPSDGIVNSLTRFFYSNDPPENAYSNNNSVANTSATGPAPAPGPKTSSSKVDAKDERSPSAEPIRPEKLLTSDPKQLGFIGVIKNFLRPDGSKSELETEKATVSPTTESKPLDHSQRYSGENDDLLHRQSGLDNTSKIALSYPKSKKPGASKPENFSQAVRMSAVSPSPVGETTPTIYFGAEKKSNPFQVDSLMLLPPAPPALSKRSTRVPVTNPLLQSERRAAEIRSTRNEGAATAIVHSQKPVARKQTARLKANAETSNNARKSPLTFRIGKSLVLGRSLNPEAVESRQCFQKDGNAGLFCLERANWHQQMARRIGKSSRLYREPATIIQYKNGRAVRIYSAIPSDTYEEAVEYYSNLLGTATQTSWDKLARLGNTPLSNPSSIWVKTSGKGSMETLEIRKFDNIRGLMASETKGFIRLFNDNSDPIFSVLSDTDLILHQLRAQNMKK